MTLWSLLLALLIPSGMAVWSSEHARQDSCSRFLEGDRSAPRTEMVAVGTEMVEVPCEEWLVRQSPGMQLLWIAELLVVLVFAIHAAGDVREWMRARGQSR